MLNSKYKPLRKWFLRGSSTEVKIVRTYTVNNRVDMADILIADESITVEQKNLEMRDDNHNTINIDNLL